MPYCPECHYEYRVDIRECPDCGAKLVEELPADSVPETEWVAIHPLPGTIYAEMVKDVLDQQKIPAILVKNFLSSAYGITGTDLGGNETIILVPRQDKEKADRILYSMLNHI